MNKLNYVLGIFLILILTTTFATTTLPNGEAPVCMGIDPGNFSTQSMLTFNDFAEIKATGVNCITFDIRAGDQGWAWRGWNDTNFEPYDALINHAYTNYGLYSIIAPVWQSSPYLPNWIDNNASWKLNRARHQTNFPNASPTYTPDLNTPSIWDENYLYVQNHWYNLVAEHYKNNSGLAGYINGINEGYEEAGNDTNTTGGDLNRAWFACLNTKYDSNVTKLNSAWGFNFSAITDANIPITNTPAVQMKDWWDCKSTKIAELLSSGETTLKASNTNKIIFGVKITTPSTYSADTTGYVGFREGYDINKYIATSPADYVSIDIYPNSTNIETQALNVEENIALIKAMADKVNKPIYIGELFPTEDAGNKTTHSTQYFSQMLNQLIAFSGSTTNTGVRALSYYVWYVTSYNDGRNIKDSKTENLLTKVNPLIKYQLKNGTNAITSNIAVYDNLTENKLYNGSDYYITNMGMNAAISSTKKWSNKPTLFFYDNSIPTSSVKTLIANPINYKTQNLLDINSWVANGGMLITSYRVFEEDENHRSSFGAARTGTALALAGVNLTNWLTAKDINAKATATKQIISSVATDSNIYRYAGSGDLNTPYENISSLIAGWKADANLNQSATPLVVSNKNYGLGARIHIGIHLGTTYAGNQTNPNLDANNWNYAWKDFLTYKGGTLDTNTPYTNFYVWDTTNATIINAFGTTSGSTNLIGGKDFVIIKSDSNTLSYSAYKSTPTNFVYTPALDINQTKVMFKGNSIVARMNVNEFSDANLLIDNTYIGSMLPITASIHDSTTIYVDSNIDGNISGQVLFSSPICTTIRASYTTTNGATSTPQISCNGRDGIIYLASIEDSNATNRNVIVLNSSTNAIVASNACGLVDLIPIILAAAILIGLVIAMQLGVQINSGLVVVLVVGAIVGVIGIVVYSSVIVSFCG